MSKKVLIISTSLRHGSNSDTLADEFARGAVEKGHQVEQISLKDKQISFCRGCLACQKTQKCVIKDDAGIIVEKMKEADVLVFATPIYYYEMSGQMKTLLDRSNPLFAADYKFRDIYLLATAADEAHSALERAINGLGGWIECFPQCLLKGVVYGTGASEAGDIKGMPALQEAYEAGQRI